MFPRQKGCLHFQRGANLWPTFVLGNRKLTASISEQKQSYPLSNAGFLQPRTCVQKCAIAQLLFTAGTLARETSILPREIRCFQFLAGANPTALVRSGKPQDDH